MHPYLDALQSDSSDGQPRDPDGDPTAFRRPGTAVLWDEVTDAAMDLLARGGPDRITLGSIAKRLVIRPSTLHSRTGGLAELLVMVAETFAWRWNRWATNPYLRASLISVPRTATALEAARVWLALLEVAAGEPRAGRHAAMVAVREAVEDEVRGLRGQLSHAVGRPVERVEGHLAMAVGLGPRTMLAHGLGGLREADADEVIALIVTALSGGRAPSTV